MKKIKTFKIELDFSKLHIFIEKFDYISEQVDIGKNQLNEIKQNYIEGLEKEYKDVVCEIITPLFYFEDIKDKHYLEEKIKITTGKKGVLN